MRFTAKSSGNLRVDLNVDPMDWVISICKSKIIQILVLFFSEEPALMRWTVYHRLCHPSRKEQYQDFLVFNSRNFDGTKLSILHSINKSGVSSQLSSPAKTRFPSKNFFDKHFRSNIYLELSFPQSTL